MCILIFKISVYGGGGSSSKDWVEKQRVLGSSPGAEKDMEGCSGSRGGAQTLPGHRRGSNPRNAQIGPCNELPSYSGMYKSSSPVIPKEIKRSRKENICIFQPLILNPTHWMLKTVLGSVSL